MAIHGHGESRAHRPRSRRRADGAGAEENSTPARLGPERCMNALGDRFLAAWRRPIRPGIHGRSTLSKGHGSKVWDVDGTEMVDFHNGFGSMVQGHANPAIVKAVQDRSPAAPTLPRRSKTHRRQRGAGAPLRSAAMALCQLRLRSDHGRHPHRPRLHRPRHDHEDLRLVPRPSRLRHGLDRRPLRDLSATAITMPRSVWRRIPEGRHRP